MAEKPSFSNIVLEQLRAAHYHPRAWARMLSTSWIQARTTAYAHPHLVQGWRRIVGILATATLGFAVYTGKRHGRSAAWKTTIPVAIATLTLSGDQYVHLGLHRQETGQLYPRLGSAMTLTALRGWIGLAIASRWLVDIPLTNDEALGTLLVVLATDIGDGWLARRCQLSSALGHYLDGEADMISWTAITLAQVRQGLIPVWFLVVHGLRWGLPLALGFSRTFATARSTLPNRSKMGRLAGASQALLAASAICSSLRSAKELPPVFLPKNRPANQPDARFQRPIYKSLLVFAGITLGLTALQHIASILRS
jgi:phosphatidylglycerophosphate synthase